MRRRCSPSWAEGVRVRRANSSTACPSVACTLEAAINEADKLDLIDPDSLRAALGGYSGRPGVAALRAILDRQAFRLTDSDLERRFLAIVRRTGLPFPDTGRRLNGFKVDFHWPDLGLVVETDGLRYHRTPSQQARDRLRDQAHAAAGGAGRRGRPVASRQP